MGERLRRESPAAEADRLWTATYILLGLRYEREFAVQLLRGVRAMRESVTWQAIFEEGEQKGRVMGNIEEARKLLVLQGAKRLGPPNAETVAALNAVNDLAQLEALLLRVLDVGSWQELIPPRPPRHRPRRS